MCKEHIKVLQQVIKSNGRYGLPILKSMAHENGVLRATNLEQMVEVATPTIADGIWKSLALDYGFRDDTKETEFDLEDYPTIELDKVVQEVELSSEDMAKIIRAMDFASNDQNRPVLTGVVLKHDFVYASDGYKAYRNSLENHIQQVVIPKQAVKFLKTVKADKHGTWLMTIYEKDMVVFSNGNFKLYTKTIDGSIPDYDAIFNKLTHYNYHVRIDMKQIKDKKNKFLWGDVDEQKVYVVNDDNSEKILLTECLTKCDVEEPVDKHCEIVMPLTTEKSHIVIDLKYLSHYKKTIDLYIDKVGQTPIEVVEQ